MYNKAVASPYDNMTLMHVMSSSKVHSKSENLMMCLGQREIIILYNNKL